MLSKSQPNHFVLAFCDRLVHFHAFSKISLLVSQKPFPGPIQIDQEFQQVYNQKSLMDIYIKVRPQAIQGEGKVQFGANESKENVSVAVKEVLCLTAPPSDSETDKVEKLLQSKDIQYESHGMNGGIKFGKTKVGRRKVPGRVVFLDSNATVQSGGLLQYYILHYDEPPIVPGKSFVSVNSKEEVFASFDDFFDRLTEMLN